MSILRIRLAAIFINTALAGFVIHCIQAKVAQQPLTSFLVAWIFLCVGTLTSIFLSTLGIAFGGRIGAVIGVVAAFVAWSTCLWILGVLEEEVFSSLDGVHLTSAFAVSAAGIYVVFSDSKDKESSHALDDHSVGTLLTTKQGMEKSPDKDRR